MKFIRRSLGPAYLCRRPWPDDSDLQCGGSERRGFFIEGVAGRAGWMRQDSKVSIEDAEEKLWNEYLRKSACTLDHRDPANFDRRDYRNGVGFCKGCNYSAGDIFDPLEVCCNCGKKTYHSYDKNDNWWCENCPMPEELWPEYKKTLHRASEALKTMSDAELAAGIKEVFEHIAAKAE